MDTEINIHPYKLQPRTELPVTKKKNCTRQDETSLDLPNFNQYANLLSVNKCSQLYEILKVYNWLLYSDN